VNKNIFLLKIIIIVLCTCPIKGYSQTLGSLKAKYEYIGTNSNEFNALAIYGKQRNMNWCWAACIQMVLNYHRIPITQEDVVRKSLGKLVDRPANSKIIFNALNGKEINAYGKLVKINCNTYSTNTDEIISFISSDKPLIVGIRQQSGVSGHAYVLIGVYLEVFTDKSGTKKYKPDSVLLIDPWPGNNSVKNMKWLEFTENILTCYKVWINEI
jgi:hypothetical protein